MNRNIHRVEEILREAHDQSCKTPAMMIDLMVEALERSGLINDSTAPAAEDTSVYGEIAETNTNSYTRLGGGWKKERIYKTVVTVEIDTTDLNLLDITRPITIHQEPNND